MPRSSAPIIGSPHAVVLGAGPAGLSAAEVLAQGGVRVDIFDAMPSVGRKFLLAGRGGLNLTHAEPVDRLLTRYGAAADWLDPIVRGFDNTAIRQWAAQLGIDTFVGSSRRVFPTQMKAAPLLRAWVHRLRVAGVRFHARSRWIGWDDDGALLIEQAQAALRLHGDVTVLALGGASWPQLGSNGAWVPALQARGVAVNALRPANCGFDAAGRDGRGWSPLLRERHAGAALKQVVLRVPGRQAAPVARPSAARNDPVQAVTAEPADFVQQGEFVLTQTGIEGSLVYAAAAGIRDRIADDGRCTVELDLICDRSTEQVHVALAPAWGKRSASNVLRNRLGLTEAKLALVHELLGPTLPRDAGALAKLLKALPLVLLRPRPLAEAISTAGGVACDAVDAQLMLRALPGVFCAGEMLDWEAPTGGYLLTACLATGRHVGHAALRRLHAART